MEKKRGPRTESWNSPTCGNQEEKKMLKRAQLGLLREGQCRGSQAKQEFPGGRHELA